MADPRKEGPKVLNMCIIVSAVTGLYFLVSVLFCVSDLDTVLSTPYL
jgi:hypothetical protein